MWRQELVHLFAVTTRHAYKRLNDFQISWESHFASFSTLLQSVEIYAVNSVCEFRRSSGRFGSSLLAEAESEEEMGDEASR